MGDEFGGAGGHGDLRIVAEATAGGGEVEPVVFREFGGDEAGHGRFAAERKYPPNGFADGADRRRRGEGNAAGDGRFAEGGEELIDPIPEDDGLAIGDEVGAAGCGGVVQGGFGEEVGVDGVLDVDHVDLVGARADDAEATGAGAGEDARNQVRIADTPDQVWTKGDRAKVGPVGGEDFAFGDGFGERIRGGAGRGEREGFVGAGEVATVVDDAGRGGVDEVAHAGGAGGDEEGAGAEDVGAKVVVVAAPHADAGGDVENGFDAGAGGGEVGGVGSIEGRGDEANATRGEVGRGATSQDGDGTAGGEEAFD